MDYFSAGLIVLLWVLHVTSACKLEYNRCQSRHLWRAIAGFLTWRVKLDLPQVVRANWF